MAWEIFEFEGVSLPTYDVERQADPGQVDPSLLDSIGGVSNYFGDIRQLPRRATINLRGIYVGEQAFEVGHDGAYIDGHDDALIVTHDAYTDLRSQIAALWRQLGVYGQLWRRWHTDATKKQWKQARLLHVPWQQSYGDVGLMANVSCVFETEQIAWREETQQSVSESVADGVLKQVSAHNDGDVPINDAVLTVTRTSGTITSFTVVSTALGVDFVWTGTIGAGESVVLNNGSQTIKRGTTDVYSGLTLNAGHTVDGWLPLRRGSNPLIVQVNGGAATVAVTYYHQRL